MHSPARTLRRSKRFFAWTAALAVLMMLGLLGLDVGFPPDGSTPYASGTAVRPMDFNVEDFLLLVGVTALVVAVASMAGWLITSLLTRMETRREEEAAIGAHHARHGRNKSLDAEPANERLRALRAVTSSLEETPVRKA